MSSCRQFISKLTHARALAYTPGVRELVRVCNFASSFGVKVFPHGHSIYAALHVVASQSRDVCPLVERLIFQGAHKMHFQKGASADLHGVLKLPVKPGFGIELDERKIEKTEIK